MSPAVETFRENGFLMLPSMTEEQVKDVLLHLGGQEVFSGRHVVQGDAEGFSSWSEAAGANVLCWRLSTAVLAPHLLERALGMLGFAREYLETDRPLLYSMNVFCTRPGQPVRPDIQDWHRDQDDRKFLPMFFYLTDVGPDARQELRFDGRDVHIEGPRGTVFLSDTMREHRGLKPQVSERIIAWARWGVSDPPASYTWDKLAPIPAALLSDRYPSDPAERDAIRLLVSPP